MKIDMLVKAGQPPSFVVSAETQIDRMLLTMALPGEPGLALLGKSLQDGEITSFQFGIKTAAEAGVIPQPAPLPQPLAAPSEPQEQVARKPREKKPRPPKPPPVEFMNEERITRLSCWRSKDQSMHVAAGGNPADWEGPVAINIRGTSGSGKSHIVHHFLDTWSSCREPVYQEGRKAPIGYLVKRSGRRDVFVAGSYETKCGGCDGISGHGALDTIYDIVEQQVTVHHRHVLFEGLIVCSDFKRSHALAKHGFPIEIVMLNTSLEKCKENIDDRRRSKGDEPLGDHRNTEAKFIGNQRSVPRFRAAGVDIKEMSVEETIDHLEKSFS